LGGLRQNAAPPHFRQRSGMFAFWNDFDMNTSEPGYIVEFDTAVPIPSTIWLLASGLLGYFGIRKKIRK
jgi:hypothetical protein